MVGLISTVSLFSWERLNMSIEYIHGKPNFSFSDIEHESFKCPVCNENNGFWYFDTTKMLRCKSCYSQLMIEVKNSSINIKLIQKWNEPTRSYEGWISYEKFKGDQKGQGCEESG